METRRGKRPLTGDDSAARKRQELQIKLQKQQEEIAAQRDALLARERDLRQQLSALPSEVQSVEQQIRAIEAECQKTDLKSRVGSLIDRIGKLYAGRLCSDCQSAPCDRQQCGCVCHQAKDWNSESAHRKLITDELEPGTDDPLLYLSAGEKMQAMSQLREGIQSTYSSNSWLDTLVCSEWV